MYIIESNSKDELTIKKSKFICYLFKINNEEDISNYLNQIKNEYKDSSHICYAYILGNIIKYSDDKEPSKTAGYQILNVLLNKKLTNTLAIVIRYFGGIKLGTGPLSKAYKDVTLNTLNKTKIIDYKEYITLKIETNYNDIKKLNYLLKDIEVIDKDFSNNITYIIKIDKKEEESIKKLLNDFKII